MVSPDFGRDSQIAVLSARSSYLGAAAVGPSVGDCQSGGLVLAYFYSSSIFDDNYGFFIARAYGELKNECSRLSVGVDGDVINPLSPEMIDWAAGGGAGNLGFLRAQFRMERYFYPSDERIEDSLGVVQEPLRGTVEQLAQERSEAVAAEHVQEGGAAVRCQGENVDGTIPCRGAQECRSHV